MADQIFPGVPDPYVPGASYPRPASPVTAVGRGRNATPAGRATYPGVPSPFVPGGLDYRRPPAPPLDDPDEPQPAGRRVQ